MSAAVTNDAVIAGEGAVAYGVEHAEFVGQGPGLLLVAPHQRCVQAELLVHSQVERRIQALNESVTTIGITAEVCLTYTRDDVVDAVIASIDGSHGKEEKVSSRHKSSGVGRTFLLLFFDIKC